MTDPDEVLDEPVRLDPKVARILESNGGPLDPAQPGDFRTAPRWADAVGRVLLGAVYFVEGGPAARLLVARVARDRELQHAVVSSLKLAGPVQTYFLMSSWEEKRDG